MKRVITVAVIAVAQLALVGVAVSPQLSARVTGDEYLVRVAPLDPIDPYRGAYASLGYPDLRRPVTQDPGIDEGTPVGVMDDGRSGTVYITLRQDGAVWVGDTWTRERPTQQPYLTCDDHSWQIRCGIESWFVPQDEAQTLERDLADGAYAELRIDSRGNAAVVDVRERP